MMIWKDFCLDDVVGFVMSDFDEEKFSHRKSQESVMDDAILVNASAANHHQIQETVKLRLQANRRNVQDERSADQGTAGLDANTSGKEANSRDKSDSETLGEVS